MGVTIDMLVVDGIEFPFRELHDGVKTKLDFHTEERSERQYLGPLCAYFLSFSTSLNSIDFSNNYFGTETEAIVNTILRLPRGQLLEYNGMDLRCSTNSLSVQQKPVM